MKRLFWTGLGVAAGVLVTRKATRAVEAFTPTGMADRLAESVRNLGDAVRQFGEDVRDGMWEREDELHEALGLNDPDAPDPARGVSAAEAAAG